MNKIALLLFIFPLFVTGQRQLSLEEAIEIAQENSIEALIAETRRENAYWRFRRDRSDYFPEFTLYGDPVGLNRSFTGITQPDGSLEYRELNQNRTNLGLAIQQDIGLTGTRISMRTTSEMFNNFIDGSTQFNADPFFIRIQQPLFQYNRLAWQRKIYPLDYEISKLQYVQDQEEIAGRVTQLFFNLLIQQVNLNIERNNFANNDTIYKIAEGRYKLGRIAENELINLELNLRTAERNLSDARLNALDALQRLKSYLGLGDSEDIELILPDEIPEILVNEQLALEYAKNNNSEYLSYRLDEIQAEAQVAQARGDAGLNANLNLDLGLTNSADQFSNLYSDPSNNQRVGVSVNVPILDWGRRKSRLKTAEASAQLTKYQVDQNRTNFEQEVLTQVRRFNGLRDQIELALLTSDLAQQGYDIAYGRFRIGKISIIELNNALENKDAARRAYIRALSDYWNAYYDLRRTTLYDFRIDAPLFREEDFSPNRF